MDLNRCDFIGRIGQDLDLRQTTSGKSVLSFTIAVNGYKDDVQWVSCVAWEKTAEILNQYCGKGSRIYVSGRWQTRSYDKDGITHYKTEVVVNQMQMLGNKGNSVSKNSERTPPPENDIPF
jgi:single-strand DNA-binding protein